MIRLKSLLIEYDNELILPKVYVYNKHIVMLDKQTGKDYHYELYADKIVDINVDIVKINMQTREITYIHPVKQDHRVAELNDMAVAKIAQEYKTTPVGDIIDGMKSKAGDDLYLKRIK